MKQKLSDTKNEVKRLLNSPNFWYGFCLGTKKMLPAYLALITFIIYVWIYRIYINPTN